MFVRLVVFVFGLTIVIVVIILALLVHSTFLEVRIETLRSLHRLGLVRSGVLSFFVPATELVDTVFAKDGATVGLVEQRRPPSKRLSHIVRPRAEEL